jgi:hypothetical protein
MTAQCFADMKSLLPRARCHPPGVLLHLLLSTFLWMPSYYSKLWQVDTAGMVPLLTGASLDNYGLMKPGEAVLYSTPCGHHNPGGM